MLDILLTASVSFIITFLGIPVIIQVAEQKKLYDIPDERKVHTRLVASLGGVGIFGGFLLAALLSIQGYLNPEFQYFFAAALVIFFLGLKDDIMILSATKKFIGQIIAASILIHLGGIRLDSMYGLLGFNQLPEGFSMALSYLTIIVVINSFNLIDGVDGLAGSLALMAAVVFGIYFYKVEMLPYAILSFATAGSLVAFLIFNFQPAKIFMGDTGSLLPGLKGERLCPIRIPNTRKVSSKGTINMVKPIAGAECMGIFTSGKLATLINLITRMAFISPSNNDPVSPIKIFAG